MIGLVDYGSGNIQAIANIYARLNIPTFVAREVADLERATKIVLPGVGAFDQTMRHLEDSGLRKALTERVVTRGVPFLGICVGMQLLARRSDEGALPGLGWIDAEVQRFDHARFRQRTHLPHMGWNDVNVTNAHPLFAGLEQEASFYFLHSYHMVCARPENVLAEADYGGAFTCAVHAANIFGVQFHPEKSHQSGIRLLQNFAGL
jgi:glutamine amidotransferase